MSNHEELPSIDPDTLEDVTGGATSTDSQLTAAIQSIQSSIKSIGAANNNNGNALTQMLPFLLMARGGASGGSIAGGACPCGCGMVNCRR